MKVNEGSIIELERGKRYKVRLSLGYDPIEKRYRQMTRTVRGSLSDARRVLGDMVDERRRGMRLDADKVTFYEYSAEWLEQRAALGGVSRGTLDKDGANLATLNGYLSAVRLRDISPDMVRRLLPAIKADKTAARGSYSNATLSAVLRLLKQVLQAAVNDKLIPENPAAAVKAPTPEPPNREGLKRSDAAALAAFVEGEYSRLLAAYAVKEQGANARGELFTRSDLRGFADLARVVAVRIGLATGMRRGEVFALVWDNVDLQGGVIHVRRSLTARGELKQPKSRNGIRDIHIDAETVAALSAWADFQRRELRKLRKVADGDTPVCCSAVGGFSDLRNFGRFWADFRARAGFPGLKFHELRHTQASLLIAGGVDVKTVQTRLGHYSAALTLNWYAHANPDNDKAAGDMVGDLLGARAAQAHIMSA